MTTCPSCKGARRAFAFVSRAGRCRFQETSCLTCRGSGKVPDDYEQRRVAGDLIRHDRINRKLGLGDEARRLGITPVQLSMRERGADWSWDITEAEKLATPGGA